MADQALSRGQQIAMGRGDRLLSDFAEDFMIYRRRGLTNRQIAAAMGYRSKFIVGRLATRARALGLLPRPNRRMTS